MIPRGGSQGMGQTSVNSLMFDAAEILGYGLLEHLSYNAGTIGKIPLCLCVYESVYLELVCYRLLSSQCRVA